MRLIDADALKKDDELTEWITKDSVRTGKMLKAFSELFIKKIDDAPTVCDIEQYAKEHNLFICTTNIIEQIREEILNTFLWEGQTEDALNSSVRKCLEIIDKYAEQEQTEERQNRDFNIECQNHNAMLHKAQENVIEKFKSCADMFSDEELKGAETVMNWIQEETQKPQEPCDDAVSRQAVIKAVDAHTNDDGTLDDDISVILENLPPVTQKPKYWIDKDNKLYKMPDDIPQKSIECDDAVSRQAVLDVIYGQHIGGKEAVEHGLRNTYAGDLREIADEIIALPSVRPQEPKTGHWINVSDGYGDNAYICECSECKDTVWVYKDADRKWNYCPNCGAKMVEPQESEVRNDYIC